MGIIDRQTHGHHLWELESGEVQLYLRDPAGNLIEIVWPQARMLAPETAADLKKRGSGTQSRAQDAEATLFLIRRLSRPA